MFPLELTQPAWLAAFVALPVVGFYFYWTLSDFPRGQRIVSLVIRSLIVTLLVLTLAGLTLLQPTQEQYVIFAVDQSQSVGEETIKAAEKYLDEAVPAGLKHKVGFLPFAMQTGMVVSERVPAGPAPEASVSPMTSSETSDSPDVQSDAEKAAAADAGKGEVPQARRASPTANDTADAKLKAKLRPAIDAKGTNLAAAIEAAAGSMPPAYVPQIVILSDGNQTHGDAIKSALRAGIPVSTVVLPARSELEVQVSAVEAPAQVREGEPFFVEVVIDSNHEDEALVEVYRGDHKVVGEKRPLKKGENRFRFQQQIERERLAQYSARVSGAKSDTLLDNNAESALVFTAGKPRILIIESDPNLIRELMYGLEQEGMQVDVRPPQGMPENLSDLQNYELLILSNVPATSLSQQQMEVARTYVQDLGGGFMMLGGEQSFGLGGYYKTVLEEILPVRSDFEKEKEKPSLGMVLVVDRSGSMGGEKLEMAKSAAAGAVELLGPRDKIGVVMFDHESYIVAEMQEASNKAKVIEEIMRIECAGGTNIYPGMEDGYNMLKGTVAKLKHMIVLTDGHSAPGDFAGLAQQMQGERMTISTVGVGDADNVLLEEIAKVGGGRHYATDDASQVPQIFAKETVTASKAAIDEQPFIPQVIRTTRTLQDINFEEAPFLLGYVMTRPKPTCELILATEKGDPLLAWWRYGLGMTVAFTSDAKSRWAAEWLTWPGYGKFWAQVVRHTMRKSDAKGIVVQTVQKSGQVTITVDAVDTLGRFLNQAQTDMNVIDPQLGTKKITLQQTAPGRYVTKFETPLSGAYHLDLQQTKDGQVLNRQSRGISVGYSDELRLRPANEALMKTIAEVSGGKFNPTATEIFAPTARTASRPTPLWPWLLSAAVILLVLDVALRRIDFSSTPWQSKSRLESLAGFQQPKVPTKPDRQPSVGVR